MKGLLLVALLVVFGAADAARVYPDRAGDVKGAPDVVSVRLSDTASTVVFQVRFAHAPPLRVDQRAGWVDMLLIAIDVPPLGPPPAAPGGEWPGANYALGTHGPSRVGRLVRLGKARPVHVADFAIRVSGRTLAFSIPRRALGNPAWFAFSLAAAREGTEQESGGIDLVPERGTYRYRLSAVAAGALRTPPRYGATSSAITSNQT